MKKFAWTLPLAAVLVMTATVVLAADKAKEAKPAAKAEAAAPAAAGAVASVDGVPVTPAELDEALGGKLLQLRVQEYELKRQTLDTIINGRLVEKEAKARSLSAADLTKQEVDAKAAPTTPEEVQAAFERVKSQIPQGMTEADAKTRIESNIRQKKVEDRRSEFYRELWQKSAVKVLLDAPRMPVNADLGAAKGPAQAPVTIVEFSDFQCPYCSRVGPTLKQVEERYGDRIRIVFREYPLPMHPQAPKAAEAGECAHEQGKFWEMHDRMFSNQQKLQPDDLKASAAELGLDAQKFNECLDSGKNAAIIKRDMDEGQRFGVNGTPAFFINGRPLTGAVPFDAFAKVIDEELARAGVPVPPPAAAKVTAATPAAKPAADVAKAAAEPAKP
jgi:protein-disulfide isomerase